MQIFQEIRINQNKLEFMFHNKNIFDLNLEGEVKILKNMPLPLSMNSNY